MSPLGDVAVQNRKKEVRHVYRTTARVVHFTHTALFPTARA